LKKLAVICTLFVLVFIIFFLELFTLEQLSVVDKRC